MRHGDITRQHDRVRIRVRVRALSATPPPHTRQHTLTPTFPEDRDPHPDSHQSGAPTPSKPAHHSNAYLHSLGALIMGHNTRISAPKLGLCSSDSDVRGPWIRDAVLAPGLGCVLKRIDRNVQTEIDSRGVTRLYFPCRRALWL